MASKTVIAFLFILISAATAGNVKQIQSSASDTLISKDRQGLCDEPSGERSVSVRVFNLTNAADFINATKPFPHIGHFKEVGPFNFKEKKSRENCLVALKDLSINFESVRELLAESSSDFDAPLNIVNVAFAHFGIFATKEGTSGLLWDFIKRGDNYLMQNTTARDLLVEGYNISGINSVLRIWHPFNLTELQKDRLGPFSELSYPKQFTLRSDPETFGQVVTLDGRNVDHQIEGSNVVPATDGTVFLGNITEDTKLTFYSEDLCSVVPLVFKETTTFQSIKSFKFVLREDAMAIAARGCEPAGEYSQNANVKTCFPNGGVDVKKCQQNLPYVVSLPHFLNAHSNYTQNVTGMNPNIDEHQSYFIIEPVTGNVLESSLKFQLNVNLLKLKNEDIEFMFKDIAIQDTIVPLFWTDKKFSLAVEKLAVIQKYLEELAGTTTESEDATTTSAAITVGTTPSVSDTTQSPGSNPTIEDIVRQINDLSTNLNHFTNTILCFGIIISILTGAFMYYLSLRNKTNRDFKGSQ